MEAGAEVGVEVSSRLKHNTEVIIIIRFGLVRCPKRLEVAFFVVGVEVEVDGGQNRTGQRMA